MKKLLYVPVIHMDADLGSLSTDMTRRGISHFGEEFWEKHKKTISGFWDSVARFFSKLDASGLKVFQDGMVADGEIGLKIVEEGVKSGSKNFEIVKDLLRRGAVLVKTEELALVKEEREHLVKIVKAKTAFEKMNAVLNYKIRKKSLLKKRDEVIASKISEILQERETGILFIGAFHNVNIYLPNEIEVVEIKETEKIREYQRLLPVYKRNKEVFEQLSAYLISPVALNLTASPLN